MTTSLKNVTNIQTVTQPVQDICQHDEKHIEEIL